MKLALKISIVYFCYAMIVFLGGVNQKIDAFIWAFLSYIGYWPCSIVTSFVRDGVLEHGQIFNQSYRILGLSLFQVAIFILDVVVGTAWWMTASLIFIKMKVRLTEK